MRSSISDDNIYPNFCQSAADNHTVFDTFRSNRTYLEILEHVTRAEGQVYLDIIKRDNPQLLENIAKYSTNDNVGSPKTFPYEIGQLSPTTIRYVKVLSDMINTFGDLSGMDIVEIGCGYGGQAKIIMDTFNVKSYTLIDLKPVLNLTERYLTSLGVDQSKVFYKTLDELTPQSYDLFISNYAYTECTKNIQLAYYDKVLSHAKRGYITANFINDIFKLDYLTKVELTGLFPNSITMNEEPITHPNNFILVWK
jgi:putative sugar O-methyltransferase